MYRYVGHVSADSDSAEDIAEDADAAVDEEEDDEEEVLVEEDQIQPTVCMFLITQRGGSPRVYAQVIK